MSRVLPQVQQTVGRRYTARILLLVIVLATAPSRLVAQQPSSNPPQAPDSFVTVNGVRLPYFDWGGQGDVVLMLTPLGGSGHGFDAFAPRFTDAFHVVVLTRRGQGQSDKPASGYDLETLTADIKGFMDALHIDRAHLVGHSIAGAEMTRFAGQYPTRVRRLVYLDAANDYAALDEVAKEAKLPPRPRREPVAKIAAVPQPSIRHIRKSSPLRAGSSKAALFRASPEMRRYLDLLAERKFLDQQIRIFQAVGQVVLVHDARHYDFFTDQKHIDEVTQRTRAFLAQ